MLKILLKVCLMVRNINLQEQQLIRVEILKLTRSHIITLAGDIGLVYLAMEQN